MSVTDYTRLRVRHPDWVLDHAARFCRTMSLYSTNKMPEVLNVFMLVTPIVGVLRGVFGGIFRALWFLFWHSMKNKLEWDLTVRLPSWWHFKVLKRTRQQWEAKFPDEEEG